MFRIGSISICCRQLAERTKIPLTLTQYLTQKYATPIHFSNLKKIKYFLNGWVYIQDILGDYKECYLEQNNSRLKSMVSDSVPKLSELYTRQIHRKCRIFGELLLILDGNIFLFLKSASNIT